MYVSSYLDSLRETVRGHPVADFCKTSSHISGRHFITETMPAAGL